MDILLNESNGNIMIYDKYIISPATASTTPYLNSIDEEYKVSISNLEDIKKLISFEYDTLGLTSTRYLLNYYRISRDTKKWTEWIELNRNISNFPNIDPKDPLFVEIKWVRKGTNSLGSIRILEWNLIGQTERSQVSDGSIIRLLPGKSLILKAPFIWKVFSLKDFEIISGSDLDGVQMKFRYSQDNSRTWSRWELLTKENISTLKINPIRFFEIEYEIINNSKNNVSIQDINLIGDFQNITKDYFKTNLFGIRECCQSNVLGTTDANGNFIPATNGFGVNGQSCATDGNNLPQLTSNDKAQLYNPYQQNTAVKLLEKLSNDAQMVFGHKVVYFVTDPDKRGEDKVFNEYQLFNVVCQGDLKVSVEGNNFPDSQIVMNQFDLNLFETMQIHITKQQFKEIFGPQRRPSKEDFLYFCDINRLFTVDHSQQFRNFNNSAVYYKLILKKFNKSANVNYANNEVKQSVDKLTKNSTIDELFGADIEDAKKSIANKDQLKPLSKDPIRLEYLVDIDKELIENSSTIISRSNYDLSSTSEEFGSVAIRYKNLNPFVKVSDNLSYIIWFNIHNYVTDDVYNLFNYYDDDNNSGIKINLKNDAITVTLNTTDYVYDLLDNPTNDAVALEEGVWYCYLINLDQRNRSMEQYIYKRDCDDEEDAAKLSSTILRKEYYKSNSIQPIEYFIEDIESCQILSSDMKVTNIRLFKDIIMEQYHHKILNQYIIGDDSKYLVFADNATTRLYMINFSY